MTQRTPGVQIKMAVDENIGLHLRITLLFIFVFFPAEVNTERDLSFSGVKNAAQSLIGRYTLNQTSGGEPVGLSREQFLVFLEKTTLHSTEFIDDLLGDCKNVDKNCSWKTECPGVGEIFESLAVQGQLEADGLIDALPVALNTLTSHECARGAKEDTYHLRRKRKPSAGEAWGYSIAFSSLIIVISNIGACLGPIMERRFFKRLLQFLVAMGAGSLASTGLLVLIPESFDIISIEELGDAYVWKASVAIISIYVFFSLERILKTVLYNKRNEVNDTSMSLEIQADNEPLTTGNEDVKVKEANDHGHSHAISSQESADRVTLAWMVMSGDVIHNFVDGLSIGAAFTEDITLGISISLAVICEELPHELADIAILLHSGLSIKKSLLINFLSACVCYIGLVIGVLLGSNIAEASKWIFAIAGGLFLYVPLVDMLPDMSNHLDSLLIRGGHEAKVVAFLHTGGLLIGAGIIIFVVNISAYISV